eukprot:360874-Chlamydomonas_euryale.AAC.10
MGMCSRPPSASWTTLHMWAKCSARACAERSMPTAGALQPLGSKKGKSSPASLPVVRGKCVSIVSAGSWHKQHIR